MRTYDAANLSDRDFEQILSFLRAGGVIGFPTDTAYGLGADPFQESAARRIFEIKGRPDAKPILVLVDSMTMLNQIVDYSSVSETTELLASRFWPGPLTMILPVRISASKNVSRLVTAGTGTIGVRWPLAPFATRLVHAFGKPITATSANKSGQPSTASADEVRAQLGMDLEMLIDGGVLTSPLGSTIVDLTQKRPAIVRDGPVSRKALEEALGGDIQ
ncbi:MAG TPA: L-threonylcarbamoyladenylate synthase [Terriglobia bacterium]|nr:L-threonylcarbamoyladenylate synthase [Terriglobia bacterium]